MLLSWCVDHSDPEQVGTVTVQAVTGAQDDTTHVMIVPFGNTLPASTDCAVVKPRIVADYQSEYVMENDWSYMAGERVLNLRMTIHRGGEVIWGCTPDGSGPHCAAIASQ